MVKDKVFSTAGKEQFFSVMLKRIIIIVFFSLGSLPYYFLLFEITEAYGYEGERIIYIIRPLGGRAEYKDLGIVELGGRKAQLVTFKTNALGFRDTERIYTDPNTFLPLRVERDVSWWFGKENILEEYDQQNFTVTIKKFKGKKKINEQVLKGDGPIHNAILVAFYPRNIPTLEMGWSFTFRLPQKFEVKLVSIDEIKVFGSKFSAYHFISTPDKFEIWVSKDNNRLPLKIKGKSNFNYSLLMKEYELGSNRSFE